MRDYLRKLVYHSNSKRGSRRGSSPAGKGDKGMGMIEIIEMMKLILKIED